MADDEAQFEAMFRDHYDAVLRYALARADAATAKDAVADAFLVAWRRRDEIPARARPWLLGVARRTLADQRRAARRQSDLGTRVAASASRDAERDVGEDAVERTAVLRALNSLTHRDREVLQLVAWDGLSPPDAALALGCSRPAFSVRLLRARRRLAAALAREDAATTTNLRIPSKEMT